MDRVTLPGGKTYDALFAADNPTNPDIFVAMMPDGDAAEIVTDFSGASPIIVDNPVTGRRTYEGYTILTEFHRWPNGVQVTLQKEA